MPTSFDPQTIPRLVSSDFGALEKGEDAWIEVIRQMDRVYAELVESQVALEAKNEELENAQKFIASVMGAMSDLLIVCDTKGHIMQVNQALERLTGLETAALVGKPFSRVLQALDDGARAKFTRHFSAGEPLSDCEVRVMDAQGRSVPISVNCAPRRDHRNRLVGTVLIGRPVGELQRACRELDEALKNFEQAQQHLVSSEKMAALGRLVAGVAHELNNPISFVFGNMHAMKSYGEKLTVFLKMLDEDPSPEAVRALREELGIDRIAGDIVPLVEGTLEGAERVSDIVQDLRRFSGNQREPPEAFALEPVMRTALNWVLRGARVVPDTQVSCPEGLMVTSKMGHVHQILVNLIQNAVDALAETPAPQITLRAEAGETGPRLVVEDNGPGIAASDADRIFEPFFTTKPVGQGTGMGLYVSYRLADEAGGELAMQNRAGGGARFVLSLPETPPGFSA